MQIMKKSKDSWKFVYILDRIEIDKEKTTWILILSQYKFKFGNGYLYSKSSYFVQKFLNEANFYNSY